MIQVRGQLKLKADLEMTDKPLLIQGFQWRARDDARARPHAPTRAQTQQSERLIARANIRHWSEACVVLIIFRLIYFEFFRGTNQTNGL
jgi:hypothetical protein